MLSPADQVLAAARVAAPARYFRSGGAGAPRKAMLFRLR
jgi:hypothetical protein